ncbi:hypothetical protein DM01DRAFT_1308590 [Hesseltinella vesiculosa]|uniref:IPT/TIG domain-containing protein n=1 Tax=Hesseltinella vesiculosa TaxID=101127 RepID=A0A1X2GB42_9FUNG|nr:hypothetical protein DM01DRAFT_1308590 [Hesseltinella vesiculosa]
MAPSLDKSDTTNLESSDQVMDLFLHQVSEYNSQQLSFDNKLANANNMQSQYFAPQDPIKLENHDMHHLSATPFDFQDSLSTIQQSTPADSDQSKQSSSKTDKKGKAKNKEGSSILNVFSNPLLHAIPMLARNCLNFEDFINQAALQGEHGLLGSRDTGKQPQQSNEYATPDNLMLNPHTDRALTSKPDHTRWHVRVLGLPATGAKSRVETQIKICLQLTNAAGELATNWSHLILPEHMVARDKFKRKQQKYSDYPADDKTALNDADMLKLEAAVVCDSHPDNEIIMCASCVHRERKRMKRKRDNKVARAANKEGSAAKLAALYAHELPDLSNETIMSEERKKILLFNCSEFVEFNNGEATLPTRVTCYCRHHSEKVGFRLVFTIKDCHNHVLGTGSSPPIMITDDHKSSKAQSTTPAPPSTSLISASKPSVPPQTSPAPSSFLQRKRARPEDEPTSKPPAKRKGEVESESGNSSPNTPATPMSQTDDVASPPPVDDLHQPSPSPSLQLDKIDLLSHVPSTRIVTPSSSTSAQNPQDIFAMFNQQQQLPTASLAALPQASLPMAMAPQPLASTTQLTQNPLSSIYNRRRPVDHQQNQQQQEAIYAKMLQKRESSANPKSATPKLHRLIPSEGPVYGGAEVTVLGSNFYEGLTCLFGENPAIPTHCWSANTLLCILPPAASAGPVVVSFKEHPLMLEGQDVVLFTYFDESDRALMELALQVVGLKTMGKIEDARQIAMRIVQGDNAGGAGSNTTSQAGPTATMTSVPLTNSAIHAIYANARLLYYSHLEDQLMAALVALRTMDPSAYGLSLTNRHQHTLLHLATMCGFVRLVQLLVAMDCDINKADGNGFTALHFASWTGKASIVKALLTRSSHWQRQRTLTGKTAKQLAADAGHHHVVSLFNRHTPLYTHRHPRSRAPASTSAVRVPLLDIIPRSSLTFDNIKGYLPGRLANALTNIYNVSTSAPYMQQFSQSVTTLYTSMLDPF